MSTVANIIDRIYRDYLWPPSKRPARGRLETTVNNSITSVVYTSGIFDEPEEDLLAEGVIIELDQELMRITAVNTGTQTLTVDRAVMGSAAAAHTAGVDIIVSPRPARLTVFEAVCDQVDGLYDEDLFRIRTTDLTSGEGPIDLPTDCEDILAMRYPETSASTSRYLEVPYYEVYRDFGPATYDKAVQVDGVPNNISLYTVYKARFPRPTAETDDLADADDFDIPSRWDQLLITGAAASLMAGRDIDLAEQEFITEALEVQGSPIGTGRDIVRSLLQYRALLLERARRSMVTEYEPGIRQAVTYWTG